MATTTDSAIVGYKGECPYIMEIDLLSFVATSWRAHACIPWDGVQVAVLPDS